jgi:hypothetical protein
MDDADPQVERSSEPLRDPLRRPHAQKFLTHTFKLKQFLHDTNILTRPQLRKSVALTKTTGKSISTELCDRTIVTLAKHTPVCFSGRWRHAFWLMAGVCR